MKKNAFYAQSGGVTSVINATAAALILESKKYQSKIGKVYAGKNGILGALKEELFDTSKETLATIKSLKTTPGGAFGSCRIKLKSFEENKKFYTNEIKKDSTEYQDLLNDEEKREKFAREKFLMKKDDEDIYIIRRENE